MKIWLRCDAKSSYCQEFQVYLGKGSTQPSRNGAIFDLVWDMVKKIQGKNHVVYFDNYFASIPIAKYLYSKQILVCSTLRAGRKYLPERIKKPPKLARGESLTFQSAKLSNLTTTIWADTRFVRFLSTVNRPDIETKCLRRVGSRRIEVTQPASAFSYGKNYSAVDKFDRLCSHRVYGALGHGSNKVWKHLLFHLTNMAIANAWILYCQTSTRQKPKYYDHMAFRHELATELIGGFSSRKKSTASTSVNLHASVFDNMSGHELVRMPVKRPKRCTTHARYQPNGRRRKETIYGCFQCNSHFCQECFRLAHCSQ